MARKSLKPQLNQIRAWVREGRTDAWIAHQLEIPTAQLSEFKKQHGLTPDGEAQPAETELRDEIEAEIEAELATSDEIEEVDEEAEEEMEAEQAERPARRERRSGGEERRSGGGDGGQRRGGRRRGRRGGRRRGRRGQAVEATFEQGDEGYGLWLDPAIAENQVFVENWKDKRALRATIESNRIILERVDRD